MTRMAPRYYWSIISNSCESSICRLDVPHIVQLLHDLAAVSAGGAITPSDDPPIAPNSRERFMEASTICTSVSSSCTALLSPPQLGMPNSQHFHHCGWGRKLWLCGLERSMPCAEWRWWCHHFEARHLPRCMIPSWQLACRWLKHIQTRHNLILFNIFLLSKSLNHLDQKPQESFKNLAKVYIRIYRRRKNEKWWKM